ARTRSSPAVASSAKPCSWKPRVQPRCRGGLVRFLRRSTRTFFFFLAISAGVLPNPTPRPPPRSGEGAGGAAVGPYNSRTSSLLIPYSAIFEVMLRRDRPQILAQRPTLPRVLARALRM